MLQRLLRGPAAPLLGATWTGTTALVMLPNVSIDGRETCWTPFPKEILPNTAGAKTQSGPDSRRAVWVLLAGERLVL